MIKLMCATASLRSARACMCSLDFCRLLRVNFLPADLRFSWRRRDARANTKRSNLVGERNAIRSGAWKWIHRRHGALSRAPTDRKQIICK